MDDMNALSLERVNENAKRKFLSGVYGWMTLALVISAAAALFTASNPAMLRFVVGGRYNFFMFAIAEIALVWWLSSSIGKISTSAAVTGFVGYSILNGITLSVIFIIYTGASIASVFVSAAGMFGVMSLYGMKTKSDLRSAGRYLMMGVIGIIIASLINMLMRSSGLDWLISIATVVIFTGLTAYDTQKLLAVSEHADGSETFKKIAIIGALELYLDFINMFLALLRLFGRRR